MIGRLEKTVLDCPDPRALAAVLGMGINEHSDDWVVIGTEPGQRQLAFQRVAHYRAPDWPESQHPQQLHLDFRVDDADTAEHQVRTRSERSSRSAGDFQDEPGGRLPPRPLPVKNCWTIAEHAGDQGPGGMQDLIGRGSWDDAAVRGDVRDFVTARLGHPDGILVVDESGDLKKGVHTVGVQRQYSGTAGKIENCQLAVHLSYASPLGHTLLDGALYLPKSWSEDPARRAEAGVPDTVAFATKPQLARRLIETAVAGGLPCRWVAGDEAYGGDPQLAAAGSAMSSRSPAHTGHRPASVLRGPTRSPPACRNRRGNGCPPAPGRKDFVTTTGHSSPCPWPRTPTAAIIGC